MGEALEKVYGSDDTRHYYRLAARNFEGWGYIFRATQNCTFTAQQTTRLVAKLRDFFMNFARHVAKCVLETYAVLIGAGNEQNIGSVR